MLWITPSFGQVSGTKPNFTLTLKQTGNFTATLVLEHTKFSDVTISGAQFESIIPSDKAEITSWKFGGSVATVNGTKIDISLPFGGIDITKLTATVDFWGATISPNPTQSRDYTNPVDFTVTAEDRTTTKTYTVTVKLVKFVSSWSGGWRDAKAYNATGIDHAAGKITLDVNSADFEVAFTLADGATIAPDPNKVTDWTSEVDFKVMLGLSEKTYGVKVTVNGKDIVKVTNADIQSTMKAEIAKHGNTTNYNYIDVSGVTSMEKLFFAANDKGYEFVNFNGDISKWDVSKVTSMQRMFETAETFNKPLDDWDTSNVTSMFYMFSGASAFNQPIGNWTTRNVTSFARMFENAVKFNQPLNSWDTSNVKYMGSMFQGADVFNQPLHDWNTSNVTIMSLMFYEALAFNQNISGWSVNNVNRCRRFSDGSALAKPNKPNFKAGC